jgi:hypothetical protein
LGDPVNHREAWEFLRQAQGLSIGLSMPSFQFSGGAGNLSIILQVAICPFSLICPVLVKFGEKASRQGVFEGGGLEWIFGGRDDRFGPWLKKV